MKKLYMKYIIGFIFISALTVDLTSMAQVSSAHRKKPVDYVDNKIGVIDVISNCVIGPQMPSGSINPSPQTKNGGDDGYSFLMIFDPLSHLLIRNRS